MVNLIKLITGEEVIAYKEESKDGMIVLKNPVKLAFSPEGVAMIPFAPFSKSDKITISSANVIFETELEDEVYNQYNSQFGSGLVVSSPDLKVVKGDD